MKKHLRSFLSLVVLLTALQTLSAATSTDKFAKPDRLQKGVFNLYVKGNVYFLEIPKNKFGRDFLLGSRVVSLSSTDNRSNLVAGQRLYDPILVRFSDETDKILLLRPDAVKVADSNDPMYQAFARNNLTPIAETFDVEQRTDSSVFINVTRFFTEDLPSVEPFNEKSKPGRPLTKLNTILKAESYPTNVEFTVRNAYEAPKAPFLVVLQKSLVLLPETPMKPRMADDRVGYDLVNKEFYVAGKPMQKASYITRFKLTPKANDLPAFRKGKLVEPETPIVFYVDAAFPELWKKAIAQGIEDWRPAFESIGFKNAIVAKPYPTDSNFNPNDSRNNCFKLVVSDFSNAQGVHWTDPRSGEILQAEVLFYSNITELLMKWYFLQTAAVNPDARKNTLDDQTLSKLIRYSAAHEIGHCLGLTHNFRASYAFDTEKLRDKTFTQKFGTTPSIMDYARFNYVAQPGDKDVALMPPLLGAYDRFSIQFGYQLFDASKTPFEEQELLSKWLLEKGNNPMNTYGKLNSVGGISLDPSRQSADLGNDPTASSDYGIRNLKFILAHLAEWTLTPGSNFDLYQQRYADILKQNFDYLEIALSMISGVYKFDAVVGGAQPLEQPVRRDASLRTLRFILTELKTEAAWLNNETVQRYTGTQVESLTKNQSNIMDLLLSDNLLKNLYLYKDSKDRLQAEEYITVLSKELFETPSPDLYVRNLQKAFIKRLKELAVAKTDENSFYSCLSAPLAKEQLKQLKQTISTRGDDWSNYLMEQF